MNVLVFGGTSEGRELVEWLSAQGNHDVTVCTATEYGAELVGGLPRVDVLEGRLDEAAMEALMSNGRFEAIVDATHPYAAVVTENIAHAAARAHVTLYRLVREDEPCGDWLSAEDVVQAAELAASLQGNILLATGSKDLATFVRLIPDFRERLYVRILPAAESLLIAHELDIPISHIIAMQGPFSEELNRAVIHECDIEVMVTKASGKRGGFQEKVDAAKSCGVQLVVIRRPLEERGCTLEELKALFAA